jgi:AraC-like DNA-binding protein
MRANHTARYVAMLVEYLEGEGFDCTDALAQSGVSRQSLEHLDAVLPLSTLAHVSYLLDTMSGRPDVFLATGLGCGPAQYGEMGRAILCSATLRDSIAFSQRYYRLITKSTAMTFTESNGTAEVCWRPVVGLQYHLLIATFDFLLGAFYNRLFLILGDDMPDVEVHFSTPAPPDVNRYRRAKKARFYFSQGGLPSMRLRIDSSALDKRMPLANPAMFKQVEQRVAMFFQLTEQPQRDWKAWAEMMVRESIGHQPTLDELAVIANVSQSTLTRYLAAQGCNFRQLSNEIRHERACVMLRDHGMRVCDVAQTLGYGVVNNFNRAFKAQSGVSPTQFTAGAVISPSVTEAAEPQALHDAA